MDKKRRLGPLPANVTAGDFKPTEAQQLLLELARLRPTGVAVICQTADGIDGVGAVYVNLDPATLQLGIRMLQLEADKEILEILENGE